MIQSFLLVFGVLIARHNGGWTVLDMSYLEKKPPARTQSMKFKQIRNNLRFEPEVSGYVVTLIGIAERANNAKTIVETANNAVPHPEGQSSLKMEIFPAINVANDRALFPELKSLLHTPGAMYLSPQERACVHSHMQIIKKIAENDAVPPNKVFVIMEDDVRLKPGFQHLLQEYLAASPSRWDILSLFLHPDRHIAKVIKNKQQSLNLEATQTDFPFTGMQAYVLTHQSAKRVFDCVKHQFSTIDNMIGCCAGGGGFCKTAMPAELKAAEPVQAYIMQPSLVTHGHLETSIHPPGTHGGAKVKATDFLPDSLLHLPTSSIFLGKYPEYKLPKGATQLEQNKPADKLIENKK